MLKKGEKYINLKKSLVIFICTFDPFSLDLPVYSFEHRCLENLTLQLGDGIGTIMLNSKAKDAGSEELAAFFEYINKQTVPKDDPLIKELHKKVRDFNTEKWRRMVRTLYDEIEDEKRYSFDEGKAEGISQGIIENLKHTVKLLRAEKLSDIEIEDKIALEFGVTKEEVRQYMQS